MEIITENGKDYLMTFFAKLDNKKIDTTPFFIEMEECRQQILKNFNRKNHTHYAFLDKDSYGGNIQSILNRFSGDYFSASFIKSYMTNPATCFYSMLIPDETNTATDIGSTVHKILELYYLQPCNLRTHDSLDEIASRVIREDQDKDKIMMYINNYKDTKHYLDIPDSALECKCEFSGKSPIYIKEFNINLPTCAYVIDRVDITPEGLYIIDYKTGTVTSKNITFDGNLGQMILYKWVMEQYFNQEVKDVLICAPGLKKYLKCDCGLENQKIMIDEIHKFFKKFKDDNSRRIYEYTDEGYFTSRALMEFREIMNDPSIRFAKIPIKVYIGEEKDR